MLSLGPEFSDENFLEESQKNTSSLSSIYNFPIERPKKKPLENIEVVHKSSSKDIQKTQIVEAKTHLNSQALLFTDIELFQDMIHGKYYQFPRNCLDFYDSNIDSYEVISQNNNIYNIPGNVKRVLQRKKLRDTSNLILQFESYLDHFQAYREENLSDKKFQLIEKPNNFLEKTLRKEDNFIRTAKKNYLDKENLNESEQKNNNEILLIKKSVRNNLHMSSNSKNLLEIDSHLNPFEAEQYKDVSRISSIRTIEKLEKSPEKSKPPMRKKIEEEVNTNELNNLSEQIYLKMSKNRGIFDVSEDMGRNHGQGMLFSGQKFRANESIRSSYSFVDKKGRNKSHSKIFQDFEDEIVDAEKSF